MHIEDAGNQELFEKAYKFVNIRLRDIYAKRLGENYMLHITEGLQILDLLSASYFTKAVFCLHPLYQAVPYFEKYRNELALAFQMNIHAACLDYAFTANACLPRMDAKPKLSQWRAVNQALIADKVQNYAAFKRKLDGKHPDSGELHRYFQAWIQELSRVGAHPAMLNVLARPWQAPLAGACVSSAEGEFAARRQHDVHTGLDLYAEEGTEVLAMRAGRVLRVGQFTGEEVGSAWWRRTDAAIVDHEGIAVLYGEMLPCVRTGDEVHAGGLLGHVQRVLRRDKNRPTSMLHLEVAVPNFGTDFGALWELNAKKPSYLLNPKGIVSYAVNRYPAQHSLSFEELGLANEVG